MEPALALVGARDLLAGGIGVALAVYYTSADAPLHRYALVAVVVLVAALRIGFVPRLVRLVERVAGTTPLEVVSKHDLTRRSHHSARRHRSHRTKRHHRRRPAPSSDAPSAAEGTDTPATSGAGIGQDNTAFPASAPLNLNASTAQIALHEPAIAMDRQHPAALPPAMHEAAVHQGNNSSSSSSSSDAGEPPHARGLDAAPGAQESTGVSEFADAPATLDIHRHHRHHHRHHHHRASRHSRHSRRHHHRPHRSHRHEQEHVPSAERAADVDIRSRLERLRRRLARHQALLERITVPGDEGAGDARAQAEADAAEEEEEEWEESEDEESSESDGEFDAGLTFAATFGGATHVSVGNAIQGILNEVCSDSLHAGSATMPATLRNVLRFVRDDRKNGHDIPQDNVLTLPMFEHFFELFGRRSTCLATVVEVSAQPWFHPIRTKVEMEGLLAGLAEGTFLVSLGEGKTYDFVLHRVMRDGAILSVPLLACKDGLSLPMRLPQLPDKRQTRMIAPLDTLDAADRPAPTILEFIRLQIAAGRIRDHSSSDETSARM